VAVVRAFHRGARLSRHAAGARYGAPSFCWMMQPRLDAVRERLDSADEQSA
jgi:hypothetical protein